MLIVSVGLWLVVFRRGVVVVVGGVVAARTKDALGWLLDDFAA